MTPEQTKSAIRRLALEVQHLMEERCGNSGLNWYDRFSAEFLEDNESEL